MAILLMTLVANPAAAQVTHAQAGAIKARAPVFVVTADGTWTGRLLSLDRSTVTILPQEGAPKTWPLSEVQRVETNRWDSPLDGALSGGLAMLMYACLAAPTLGAESPHKGAAILQLSLLGALVGGSIDAAHKSRITLTLYERHPSNPERHPRGVFLTLRF